MLVRHTLWSFEPVLRELARVARVVARRRWPFVVAAAIPIIATVAYVLKAPDRYEATARVIIGKDKGPLELGPAFTPRSKELENQIEMIKGHEVAARAAALARKTYPANPLSEGEIRSALKVQVLKDTDIIEIRTEARSGGRAAALANVVADAYIEAHLRDRRKSASRAKEFIEEQVTSYERRLKMSEKDLENYKRAAGVASLTTETTELIRNEAEFIGELERTRVDLAVAESKRAYFERELRETEERLLAEVTEVSSPVAQQLQQKLINLEYRYTNLILKGYSPNHTELSALAAEIKSAKQKLAEAVAGVVREDHNVNLFTKVEKLAYDLDAARAEVAALETRERRLVMTVAATEINLLALPEVESALARLVREKEANENIYMLLLEKREEARIKEVSEVGTARVFSRAVPPIKPFAPRRKQSLLFGILCGLLLGAAAVALVEYFDRTVKSPAAAQQLVGAAVVGVIPFFGGRREKRIYPARGAAKEGRGAVHPAKVVVEAPKSPVAEAFRQLYAQLAHLFSTDGAENNVFAVTSSRAQEGKSTIAFNLALNFAQFGTPTLLVDADLERSTTSKTAGVSGRPGVADFLRGEVPWDVIVNRPGIEGLAVIGAGTRSSHPPTLLASPRLETLVETARRAFSLTIIDVPPVFPIADVALVAGEIRKFLLIVRAGVVSHQELDGAVRTLKQVGGEIIGVVLNCAEYGETYGYGYGYGYYRYHYRYGDGKEKGEEAVATGKRRKG